MKKRTMLWLLAVVCITVLLSLCACQPSGSGDSAPQTADPSQVCQHTELEGLEIVSRGEYCTDDEKWYRQCLSCGEKVLVASVDSERQHDFSNISNVTLREPTCTSPGVGQRSCVLCSFTEEFEIPVAEHTYLWYYQMEQPACTECGHAAEICAHQYELTNTAESSARFPGWRTYTCTLCQETDTVYFDQFGDYELGAIRDTVNAMAKDMGFTVIYPYGASSELADHNAYQTADYVSFKYGEANEKLEQAAKTSLEQLQQLLTDEGLNPGDHYLWIEFSYSTFAGASFFRVDIYTIRHTWPKPE